MGVSGSGRATSGRALTAEQKFHGSNLGALCLTLGAVVAQMVKPEGVRMGGLELDSFVRIQE